MPSKQNKNRLKLLKRTLVGLGILVAVLHFVSVITVNIYSGSYLAELAPRFDLDNEKNFPTVYSGLILGCCAFVSLLLAQTTAGLVERIRWLMLSMFFFYLAFDELLVIHESFAEPIRGFLSILDNSPFYHAWVIPAIAFTGGIGLFMLFIKPRDKVSRLQKKILLYIVVLAAGVITLEIVGTRLYFSPLAYKLGPVFIEEMFEISMTSLLLYRLSSGFIQIR